MKEVSPNGTFVVTVCPRIGSGAVVCTSWSAAVVRPRKTARSRPLNASPGGTETRRLSGASAYTTSPAVSPAGISA